MLKTLWRNLFLIHSNILSLDCFERKLTRATDCHDSGLERFDGSLWCFSHAPSCCARRFVRDMLIVRWIHV